MSNQKDRGAYAISVIQQQIDQLEKIRITDNEGFIVWRGRTSRLLSELVVGAEVKSFHEALSRGNPLQWNQQISAYLSKLVQEIENRPELFLHSDRDDSAGQASVSGTTQTTPESEESKSVFVVHGHDAHLKIEVARTLEKLELNPIILHEMPNEGMTIVEKLEKNAATASYAVVLLTPDDEGHPVGKATEKRFRARQNVILELGYFSGRLGRDRICVLHKGEIELPSDYFGVVYVPADETGAWKLQVASEIKKAGLPIDLNHLA